MRQNFRQIIGEMIRGARRRQGLTLKALAAKTRSTEPNLSNIESGKGNPTLSTIADIADALGLTLVLVPSDKLVDVLKIANPPDGKSSFVPTDALSVFDELFIPDSDEPMRP